MPAKADRSLPGVSFIVPVYNKAPYLNGVLAAIRAQRGEFPRQYVFVDDGSSDGSLEIVRRATEGWDDTVIETRRQSLYAGVAAGSRSAAGCSIFRRADRGAAQARDQEFALQSEPSPHPHRVPARCRRL
jgi:glycosyltransferase involved in cell wall biosynthesis